LEETTLFSGYKSQRTKGHREEEKKGQNRGAEKRVRGEQREHEKARGRRLDRKK